MSVFSKEKTINKVIEINTENILPNPAQPRKIMDSDELQSLAESIRYNGVLQPLTVRRMKDGLYELIAGERRLRAAKMIQLDVVPCIVVDTTGQQSALLSVLENLQRKDLTFFEEAMAYSALIRDWGITQEQAAVKLGKAQSTIANKLRLLRLTEAEQRLIIKNHLTERHARALLKLDDEAERQEALNTIIAKGLNVGQTEEYISRIVNPILKPRQEKVIVVKDVRLFINTVTKAVNIMQKAGVDAHAKQVEKDDYIEYIVTIPKQSRKPTPKLLAPSGA
ncbi:ParB/RepB/Spo0J family partition protein [Acetanaerobacterium elongatum]|uniref:ParB family protein n=1 Tax=Acetanaerobacterium elongatum TaxID=258515 RepID=A0A1H0DEG3_9FIRM|nr:ParB/RepB/Spo0J family partition protein [Acetanaerobacterium elongatum]SDN68565.1 ParB family protein [Acetanaerobacterium elongatum]